MLSKLITVILERKEFTMELEKHGHAVFSISYHLVLVTRYRRKVITQTVNERLKQIFEQVGKAHGVSIKEWNTDRDHVQVLLSAMPKTCMSKFVNAYKSASSRLIKKEFPQVQSLLWKEYFWSQSFYLATVGGATLEVVKKYIENQGSQE